ncbi:MULTISPECIES: hypothetical protein [unclassified Microcoleus]|uniref:hypothetical protein n=1 Tax=unclassified Microcoleus TaxID=2642155 RepID=UPI0025DEAB0B|nr:MULTISPECIES: hypothetical protein [unclassified Microcoleus]
MGNGEWGIGNWELGIGNWELSIDFLPIPDFPIASISIVLLYYCCPRSRIV